MSRHPPRLPECAYAGNAVGFLTFCAHKRRPAFTDQALCRVTLDQFRKAAAAHRVAVVAYCLMPDHVHLLGCVQEGGNIATWASACKQRSAFAARLQGIRPLWQTSFFDRMLRNEERVIDVAAYILANPVRAGFAVNIGDYPWAGSDVYNMDDIKSAMQTRPVWW